MIKRKIRIRKITKKNTINKIKKIIRNKRRIKIINKSRKITQKNFLKIRSKTMC